MSNDLCTSLNCNICLMLQERKENQQNDSKTADQQQTFQSLSTCNGCQLVRYCGRKHQKTDWPIHREFCEAVQKIKQISKLTHPFYISGQPENKEDIEKSIVQLKYLLTNALHRPLEYQEEELTSFPAYCPVCFKFKNLKFICTACLSQAYCTEEHRQSHKEEHQQVCNLLQLYYCPFKVIPNDEDLSYTYYRRVNDLQKVDLVEAFQTAFNIKLPSKPCQSLQDYHLFSLAADFSCILSICYGLCHVDLKNFETTKFVIFIIGASIEPVLWFRDIHCKFFFLQYPLITEMELYFIGPEVIEPDYKILKFKFLDSERLIKFNIYKGLFQDYCKNHTISPSLIVAYNCGFSEYSPSYNSAPLVTNLNTLESLDSICAPDFATKDTWSLGLVEILQTFETPILFTSFTQQESEFDFAALQRSAVEQQLKVHIERLFKISKNPFHDLRPLRQWYTRDKESFYYRNGYIQAIRTKLEN